MAKILRSTAKLFGQNASTNQIAQFGSLAAGSPAFVNTGNIATIQALSNWMSGWFSAVLGQNSPAIEDMNAMCYVFAYQLAYIFQAGIPEYDAGTTYYINSLCQSGGLIYQSITDNNTGNAVSNGTYWALASFGGSASSLDILEQKNEYEYYNLLTDPLDNSVASGFDIAPASYYTQGILLQQYTASGTSMSLVWSPQVLNPSDKNTTTTTNWATETNASTLTTSATRKIGATSVSFTKTNGGTTSLIKYDAGSAILGVAGYTNLYFWINFSSATDIASVKVEIDIDGSNYQIFSATTNSAGGAFVTGWNLIKIDVSTGGTVVGSGWVSTQSFRYFHIGIVTGSAATVPVVLVNAIFFSLANAQNFIPPGTEMSVFDGTHQETVMIDSANSSVDGLTVSITSALSNNYSGGYANTSIYRSNLTIGGAQALMGPNDPNGNALAGAVTTAQYARLSRILRAALSNNTISSSISVSTPQVYTVVSASGNIIISDPSNTSANLLSGDVVHVFRAVWDDGCPSFIYRGDMTLTGNSTPSGGNTTLPGTPPASTGANDYCVKKNLASAQLSVTTIGANESFVNMTPLASPDGIILTNTSLAVPFPQNIYGLWSLSGSLGYKNQAGSAPDLTVNGSITTNVAFKNGQFGSNGWSASNYYSTPVVAALNNATTAVYAAWVYYPSAASGSVQGVVTFYSGGGTGTGIYVSAGGAAQLVLNSVSYAGGALNVGAWNFIVGQYISGVTLQVFLNGVLVNTTNGISYSVGSNAIEIGRDAQGGPVVSNAATTIAQAAIWIGCQLTAAQVNQIYNNGMARILGASSASLLKYRFQNKNISGQRLSVKAELVTDTTAILPYLTQISAIKTQ